MRNPLNLQLLIDLIICSITSLVFLKENEYNSREMFTNIHPVRRSSSQRPRQPLHPSPHLALVGGSVTKQERATFGRLDP